MELINASLRLATPLIFAAMGGLLCERAGVATICLEGVMLIASFCAASAAALHFSPELALLAGALGGVLFMCLHGLITQGTRADHIVSGMAINILAIGTTPLLCKVFFDSATNTPALEDSSRFNELHIPFFSKLPVVGTLFQHNLLVYLALILPFLITFLLSYSSFGLRLKSAGEGPEALATAGIGVARVRYYALALGGFFASFGGIYLALAHSGQFLRDMTAGRGFIALAAIIFGRWQPLPVFFACLFFGFAEALQMYLQNLQWGDFKIPVQWIQSIPYGIALLILVFTRGRSRAPLALGNPNR